MMAVDTSSKILRVSAMVVVLLVGLAPGCADEHGVQGDGGTGAMVLCGDLGTPAGGWLAMNEVLNPAAPACGGDPCLVFMFEGDPSCVEGTASCDACQLNARGVPACASPVPSLAANSLSRLFCTQSCADGSPCPTGFTCGLRFTSAFRAHGGPFCVPIDQYLAAGGCVTDADCSAGDVCDPSDHRCCPAPCCAHSSTCP
jgi:hypothetical protein